jgi:hypothetical protein
MTVHAQKIVTLGAVAPAKPVAFCGAKADEAGKISRFGGQGRGMAMAIMAATAKAGIKRLIDGLHREAPSAWTPEMWCTKGERDMAQGIADQPRPDRETGRMMKRQTTGAGELHV